MFEQRLDRQLNEQAKMYYNAGDVTNTGFEAMISYNGTIGKGIEFNISANGSYPIQEQG